MLEWAGRDEDVAAPFAFLEAMAVSDSEIESLLARVARDIDWTIPCISRTSRVHAIAVPCLVIAAALAAKCGGDGSAASADVTSRGAAPAAAAASGGFSSASSDPKQFCAALPPRVQALIKMPLTVMSADDSHSDDVHAGEEGYLSCVNGNGSYRATVIMSNDPDMAFTSAPK